MPEVWDPVAVVLDTSAINSGRFDADTIETVADRLARHGVALWIPQQVIYEWAIHAADDLTSLRTAQGRLRSTGVLGAEIPHTAAAQFVELIGARCAAIENVVLLTMDGQCAADAIRDQVLGEGAGGVSRDGTRKGAVDSSIVRDVLRLVKGDLSQVVFLTNDKDFLNAMQRWGLKDFQFAAGTHFLFQKLRRDAPHQPQTPRDVASPAGPTSEQSALPSSPSALLVIVGSLMRALHEAAEADDRSGPPPAWIELSDVVIDGLSDGERRNIAQMLERHIDVEPFVELVGVRDIAVDADDDGETVTYTVVVTADLNVVGAVINNDAETVWKSEWLSDRVICVEYESRIKDGQLVETNQIGSAVARPAAVRFSDSGEAYEWLRTTLGEFSGITVQTTDDDARFPQSFVVRGPTGRVETVEAIPTRDYEWTLACHETGIEISAVDDPGARVAMERGEFWTLYEPVGLQVDGTRFSYEPFAGIAKVWQYLMPPSE